MQQYHAGKTEADMQKQIYKSIVYSVAYESIMGTMCGRRQLRIRRFITLVTEGLGC